MLRISGTVAVWILLLTTISLQIAVLWLAILCAYDLWPLMQRWLATGRWPVYADEDFRSNVRSLFEAATGSSVLTLLVTIRDAR